MTLDRSSKTVLEAAKDCGDDIIADAACAVRRALRYGIPLTTVARDIAVIKQVYAELA